jgi:hypothetical protein
MQFPCPQFYHFIKNQSFDKLAMLKCKINFSREPPGNNGLAFATPQQHTHVLGGDDHVRKDAQDHDTNQRGCEIDF